MIRLIVRNWELKLAAVVIAAALWFFVVSADRAQIAFATPVEYVGLESGLVVVGVPRETVDVQLEAPRWSIARLTPSSVRVRVDIAHLHPGDNTVRLLPEQVQAPPGATVTRISPAWLRVGVAPAATRTVAVVPQLRGVPAPDHALRRVVVEPSAVQVKGPRSTIEAQATIPTVPVDVSGLRDTVTRTVGLVLPESVYLTTEGPVQVTVEIRPEESMQLRRETGHR
jgi:YbbR domain-containing protein